MEGSQLRGERVREGITGEPIRVEGGGGNMQVQMMED